MADFKVPVIDYANKTSTVALPVGDGITDIDLTALFGAVDGMLIGNIDQSTLDKAVKKDAGPGGAAASQNAQRELKWLVSYHDAVTLDKHSLEIPCADANLIAGNTTNMDLAAGAGLAFLTAFEAHCIAPITGNAVELDSVELIGRNL